MSDSPTRPSQSGALRIDGRLTARGKLRHVRQDWQLYALILPVLVFFAIFHYWPMYGVQIAFKEYLGPLGILGSPWVGFKHFVRFFSSFHFVRVIRNTLTISLYELLVGFPIPIILALSMNELRLLGFKKVVQNITYAPYFLSPVVMVGMIILFLSPSRGVVNAVIGLAGFEPVSFMTEPGWFKHVYVWSGVWQHAGWGSVIYMAALAGIDHEVVEASIIDGTSRLQRIRHVMIPGIMSTAIVLLILSAAGILAVGFEKIYLMQNQLNLPTSDVISTYVYRVGLLGAQFSFGAAVGLFNSVVNFIVLIIVNAASRRLTGSSLW